MGTFFRKIMEKNKIKQTYTEKNNGRRSMENSE